MLGLLYMVHLTVVLGSDYVSTIQWPSIIASRPYVLQKKYIVNTNIKNSPFTAVAKCPDC